MMDEMPLDEAMRLADLTSPMPTLAGRALRRLRAQIQMMEAERAGVLPEARPLCEYHEDHGTAVWWSWDEQRGEWRGEPAWIGRPDDSDWPGYHTHWTPHPTFPAAPSQPKDEAMESGVISGTNRTTSGGIGQP